MLLLCTLDCLDCSALLGKVKSLEAMGTSFLYTDRSITWQIQVFLGLENADVQHLHYSDVVGVQLLTNKVDRSLTHAAYKKSLALALVMSELGCVTGPLQFRVH